MRSNLGVVCEPLNVELELIWLKAKGAQQSLVVKYVSIAVWNLEDIKLVDGVDRVVNKLTI